MRLALFSLFLMSGITFGYSQSQLVLPRITEGIIFDGLSNEKAWENIKPLPVECIHHILGKNRRSEQKS